LADAFVSDADAAKRLFRKARSTASHPQPHVINLVFEKVIGHVDAHEKPCSGAIARVMRPAQEGRLCFDGYSAGRGAIRRSEKTRLLRNASAISIRTAATR